MPRQAFTSKGNLCNILLREAAFFPVPQMHLQSALDLRGKASKWGVGQYRQGGSGEEGEKTLPFVRACDAKSDMYERIYAHVPIAHKSSPQSNLAHLHPRSKQKSIVASSKERNESLAVTGSKKRHE